MLIRLPVYRPLLPLACFVALLLTGCGDPTPPTPPAPPPPPPPPPAGVLAGDTVAVTIGTGGGTLSLPDGSFSITFPAGAIGKETRIKVWPFESTVSGAVSLEYAIEPTDLELLKPVRVSVAVDRARLAPEQIVDGLAIVEKNEAGEWEGNAFPDPGASPGATRSFGGSAANTDDAVVIEDELPALPTKRPKRVTVVSLWKLNPPAASVAPGATQDLEVLACFETRRAATRVVLSTTCGPSVRQGTWSVNGIDGGTDLFGKITVLSPSSRARYKAPVIPLPPGMNVVRVQPSLFWAERGVTKTFDNPPILITVTGSNEWSGTIRYSYSGDTTVGGPLVSERRVVSGAGELEVGTHLATQLGAVLYVRSSQVVASEEVTTTTVTEGRCKVTETNSYKVSGGAHETFSDPLKSFLFTLFFDADGYTVSDGGFPRVEAFGTQTHSRDIEGPGDCGTGGSSTAPASGFTGLGGGFVIRQDWPEDPAHLVETVNLHSEDFIKVTISFDLRRK